MSPALAARLRRARNVLVHRRKRLREVHPTAYIHPRAEVSRDLVAHEYAFVAPYCKLDPGVELGRYTMLARHIAVIGDDHEFLVAGTPIQFAGRPPQSRTIIEDDVWIGYGALIRRGVRIGRGAIIGAKSVVTADVAPYTIVAGAPARVIGERFADPDERRIHEQMLNGPAVSPRFAGDLSGPTT